MLDEVLDILEQQVNIKLSLSDVERLIGQESVTAEREELDPLIIQSQQNLPAVVMSHLYIYVEEDTAKEYVIYFITDITSTQEYTRGLLAEGKLMWFSSFQIQEDSHEE